jgi:hypothetical protein
LLLLHELGQADEVPLQTKCVPHADPDCLTLHVPLAQSMAVQPSEPAEAHTQLLALGGGQA